MWDLIVSVYDHCLSFYFLYGINAAASDLGLHCLSMSQKMERQAYMG